MTNVSGYLKKYKFIFCEHHSTNLRNFKRHQEICARAIRNVQKFGPFKPQASIFRKLECESVIEDEEDRFFRGLPQWDIESILMKCRKSTKSTRWVPDGKNPSVFIEEAVEYFQLIRTEVSRLVRNKWQEVFKELDMKINISECDKLKNKLKNIEIHSLCFRITGQPMTGTLLENLFFNALKI